MYVGDNNKVKTYTDVILYIQSIILATHLLDLTPLLLEAFGEANGEEADASLDPLTPVVPLDDP